MDIWIASRLVYYKKKPPKTAKNICVKTFI